MSKKASDTSLLDLPDDLLARCLPEDTASCISACQASRRLLMLGLSGTPSGALRCLVASGEQGTVRKLSVMLPALHKLTVKSKESEAPCEELLQSFFSAPAGVEPGAAWLQNITHLTVYQHYAPSGPEDWSHRAQQESKAVISSLLLHGIAAACPFLTHLSLDGLWLGLQQGTLPVHLHQLQQLQVGLQGNVDATALQQQLQALPNLHDFTFTARKDSMPRHTSTVIADAVGGQLTALCLGPVHGVMSSPGVSYEVLSKPYLQLRKLVMFSVSVGDRLMDPLLQHAPQLLSIAVYSFSLESDYSSRQCSWETVQMYNVDVQSLAYLPLRSASSIVVAFKEGHMPAVRLADTCQGVAEDLKVTAAAIAVAQSCGGLQWTATAHTTLAAEITCGLPPYCKEKVDTDQNAVAALLLLPRVSLVALDDIHVTQGVLKAVGELPSCTQVRMHKYCIIDRDVWPHVMQLLPNVKELHVYHNDFTTRDVVSVCTAATQPLTLVWTSECFTPFERQEAREQLLAKVSQESSLVRIAWK